jgi:hypothetical protein
VGVALVACSSGKGPASPSKNAVAHDASVPHADRGSQPADASQALDAAQPFDALDASQPADALDASQPVDASVIFVPADAPLLCRFCKTAPPASGSGFGPSCGTPDAPLDAMLRERFRIDEVTDAMNGPFSQKLTWGAVADQGIGLSKPASETRIEGEVMLGDFRYHPCTDSVSATATVRFATADGQLGATVSGDMNLSADALGWPKGAMPELSMIAFDDLSTARGTLDLGADPNKLELGEMVFSLTRASEGDRGFVRVRLIEFPNQAAFDAANVVTDTPSERTLHEVAVGLFPLDHCNGHGRPFEGEDLSGALGGETWHDVLAQAWTKLGSPQDVDAQWQTSGKSTSVHVELGQLPMSVCADGWTAQFTMSGHVRSADGIVDQPLTTGQITVDPYTTTVSSLSLDAPNFMAEVNLPAPPGAKSSGSATRDDAQHIVVDTLIWPPPPLPPQP